MAEEKKYSCPPAALFSVSSATPMGSSWLCAHASYALKISHHWLFAVQGEKSPPLINC